MTLYMVVIFVPIRLAIGGGNYMATWAWLLLCMVIPLLTAVGMGVSAFCIPLSFDWQTLMHLCITLAFFQIDLAVSRFLIVGPDLGSWSAIGLLCSKLNPCIVEHNILYAVESGPVPLLKTLVEWNGVLFHEIWWNVFICHNWLSHGAPLPLAVLSVPLNSCLVHAVVSSLSAGVRCFPIFLHVALAFHASGSILVPALIHLSWYSLEFKSTYHLWTMKRDWNVWARKDEEVVPAWDAGCTASMALILAYYLPLVHVTQTYPWLLSSAGIAHMANACHPVHFPRFTMEQVLTVLATLQFVGGMVVFALTKNLLTFWGHTGHMAKVPYEEVHGVDFFHHRRYGFEPLNPAAEPREVEWILGMHAWTSPKTPRADGARV